MKYKILSAEKNILPRFNNETNKDEPTLMVVTKVEFSTDDGQVVSVQDYAHLPEDVSPEYFQHQADAMQADLADTQSTAPVQAASKLADEKIQQLTNQVNESLSQREN